MTILSLFDGMACGVLAMMESGAEIDRYVAYEYDEDSADEKKGRPYGWAALTAQHNFPFIEQNGDVFKADFTQYEGIDWLIGGSPCTYWSIAQKNNRETEASGMGWELFKQYVRALHEAKPKYFIYENNKSMSKDIRRSIDEAFGFEAVLINSALVSAQNRQRLYWVGIRNEDGTYSKVDVPQPQDRGILLKDILETGCDLSSCEKAYCLTETYNGACAWNTIERNHSPLIAEPLTPFVEKKIDEIADKYGYLPETFNPYNASEITDKAPALTTACNRHTSSATVMITEPVFKGEVPEHKGTYRIGKNLDQIMSLCSDDEYIVSKCEDIKHLLNVGYELDAESVEKCFNSKGNRIGRIVAGDKNKSNDSQQYRVYSAEGKSVTLCSSSGSMGKMTGLYAVPINTTAGGKSQTIKAQYQQTSPANILGYTSTYGASGVAEHCPCFAIPTEWDEEGIPIKARSCADGKIYTVYEVKGGKITIKGKEYPIKLPDGLYIIRKLTVRECMRLQTVPEWYEFPVSDSQAYKMLGNGWTVLCISQLINCALR